MTHFHKTYKSNKLSRSNTRITLLNYCQKKYFLNYYTFAFKRDYPALWELAVILKKLKSLEMWMGEKTHLLISDYLRLLKSNQLTPENLLKMKEGIAEEMRDEFLLSKQRDYSKFFFDGTGGLSEHYYGENMDDVLESTIVRVRENLDRLIASERIEKIRGFLDQGHSVYIENPSYPDFESMKVNIHKLSGLRDINIMASPDFGVMINRDSYFILDRKSGKQPYEGPHLTDQIKVYALKLLLKTQYLPHLNDLKIEGYEVYLPGVVAYGGSVSQQDIDGILQKIIDDTVFQRSFLVDQDAFRNQPLPSHHFARTSQTKKCETCTFRKVCELLIQQEEK